MRLATLRWVGGVFALAFSVVVLLMLHPPWEPGAWEELSFRRKGNVRSLVAIGVGLLALAILGIQAFVRRR